MAKNGLMFIIIVSFLLSFSQVMAFFPNPYPYFPPQNQPTKILMIGDSHIAPGSGDNQVVGHFGEKLHTLLSDTGAKVKTYGSGGSSPYSWARGDIWIAKTLIIDETNKISKNNKNKVLSEIKEEVKPNIILITLGTNIIPLVDSNDEAGFKLRINTAKELAAQATKDGTKCIWVGPPNRKNSPDESLKKTVEAIKSAIEPTCTFIDSTVLSNNAHMVDSFHYNKQGGQEWAQKVFEIIKPKINFGTSTKQPTTTSFQKILILGDSHYAGTYGQTLDTLLKQSGHTIESFGCVSATAQHYINGSFHCVQPKLGSRHNSNPEDYTLKPITESLSSFSPNLVIISLGGNIEAATSSKEERVKQITALVKSITDKNIKCIWVGPPSKEDLNKNAERNTFYEHLKEGLGSTCQLIDSRSYAQLKESDNGHFPSGDQRAKAWAQKVFQELNLGSLSQPITTSSSGTPLSSTTSTSSTTSYEKVIKDVPGCFNPTRCREIDQAWDQKVSQFIGIGINQVWDHQTNSWKKYDDLYTELKAVAGKSTTSSIQPATISKPSASGNEYNEFIKEAAATFGVEKEFIKALMKYESNFNPSSISPTGCKGLMQVCSWQSQNYQNIRKQYNLNENYDDPKSNIFIGTYILKGKINSVKNCGSEKVKAVIAAYNAGELFINKAIDANNGNCNKWQEVWNKINENFDESENTLFGEYRSWLTRGKIDGLSDNGYVGKVYQLYLSYKQYGIEGTGKGATLSK